MVFDTLSIPAVGLVTLTSLFLLITKDWRRNIGLLGIQYIGVFLLVGIEWPLTIAVTGLIAGWIACAVIGMVILSAPDRIDNYPLFYEPQQRLSSLFYLLAAIFVGLTVISAAPQIIIWIPGIEIEQIWGGLILVGLGLLRLGFSSYPLSVTSGLLTILSGFEILYAPMENSAFTVGLLATVTLVLALIGAYLFIVPTLEEKL